MQFVPTPQQARLLELVASKASPVVILTGEAGSGKSTVLGEVAKTHKVLFLTPTHQAKGVLVRVLADAGVPNPQVTTTAAFLKKRPNYNTLPPENKLWKTDFAVAGELDSPEVPILIVDEGSMVDVDDLRRIRDSNAKGVTIISIDNAQLPPVEGEAAYKYLMAAVEENRAVHVHLEKNLRAKSSDLTNFINAVRTTGRFPDTAPETSVTLHTDRPSLVEAALAAIEKHGVENVVVLAYTRKVVNAYANEMRRRLGYVDGVPHIGELLRVDAPVKVLDWLTEYRKLRGTGMEHVEAKNKAQKMVSEEQLQTGDFVEVLDVTGPHTFSVPWAETQVATYRVQVLVKSGQHAGKIYELKTAEMGTYEPRSSPVNMLLAECWKIAHTIRNYPEMPDDSKYLVTAREYLKENNQSPFSGYVFAHFFFGVRDEFARLSSALAMTIHKAQGSGRDFVLVVNDIGGPETRELRYVAASRAREHLHILAA